MDASHARPCANPAENQHADELRDAESGGYAGFGNDMFSRTTTLSWFRRIRGKGKDVAFFETEVCNDIVRAISMEVYCMSRGANPRLKERNDFN